MTLKKKNPTPTESIKILKPSYCSHLLLLTNATKQRVVEDVPIQLGGHSFHHTNHLCSSCIFGHLVFEDVPIQLGGHSFHPRTNHRRSAFEDQHGKVDLPIQLGGHSFHHIHSYQTYFPSHTSHISS